MTSCHQPLFGTRSLTTNLFELGATVRGNGGRREGSAKKEPSFWGHKSSSCKAFGKVRQSKSIQGSVKHRPGVQWEGGGRNRRERERAAVLACKLVKTLALTLSGVWEHGEKKTSSRVGDEDNTPQGRHAKIFSLRVLTKAGSFQTFQLSQITNWVL